MLQVPHPFPYHVGRIAETQHGAVGPRKSKKRGRDVQGASSNGERNIDTGVLKFFGYAEKEVAKCLNTEGTHLRMYAWDKR